MILSGKNINMRTVEIDDAEFIFTMRQNESKTKYLSKVSGSVETQKEWIKNYKQREKRAKRILFCY